MASLRVTVSIDTFTAEVQEKSSLLTHPGVSAQQALPSRLLPSGSYPFCHSDSSRTSFPSQPHPQNSSIPSTCCGTEHRACMQTAASYSCVGSKPGTWGDARHSVPQLCYLAIIIWEWLFKCCVCSGGLCLPCHAVGFSGWKLCSAPGLSSAISHLFHKTSRSRNKACATFKGICPRTMCLVAAVLSLVALLSSQTFFPYCLQR